MNKEGENELNLDDQNSYFLNSKEDDNENEADQ